MFALRLRQIYHISDKVIIRSLRSRRLEPRGPNPGLDNRLKTFDAEDLRPKDDDPENVLEQSESDFHNVGEAYNEHMNETLMGKHELRHRIVKEKYFKEVMPNLLTWSEKEQIRHLATTEPDEWTPEKLAQSFPVTVPVVKKLLKYPWKPASQQRIARHDENAMRNWKELKEGSLDIPQHLREQFLTFSNRTIPPLRQEAMKIELKKEDNLGEFESIVRRCASKEQEQTNQETNNDNLLALPEGDIDDEKKLQDGPIDPKRVTLDRLANKLKKRIEGGFDTHISDKLIVNSMQASVNVQKPEDITREVELFKQNNDQNSLVQFKENIDDPKEIMNYPERIRIPKKAYKKGATYKVNDCFYDHDGKFLYRVLGMSN